MNNRFFIILPDYLFCFFTTICCASYTYLFSCIIYNANNVISLKVSANICHANKKQTDCFISK